MNLYDELAEELGYTICPLSVPNYIHCDEDCENCEKYIDFREALEEREEKLKNNG